MITARIKKSKKNNQWYVTLIGENNRKLFHPYNRKADALHLVKLLSNTQFTIDFPDDRKKAVKKKKKK